MNNNIILFKLNFEIFSEGWNFLFKQNENVLLTNEM